MNNRRKSMLSCSSFEEAIWQAAETGQTSPELARHLRECPRCQAVLQTLTGAMRGFVELRAVQAPDPCAAVHARLSRSARPAWLLPAWGGALALCCLFALLCSVGRLSKVPHVTTRRPATSTPHISGRIPAPIPLSGLSNVNPPRQQKTRARGKPMHRLYRNAPLSSVRIAVLPRQPRTLTAVEILAQPCRQYTTIDPNFRPPSLALPEPATLDPTYCALVLPRQRVVREPLDTDGYFLANQDDVCFTRRISLCDYL
jgi:hypothetical protein